MIQLTTFSADSSRAISGPEWLTARRAEAFERFAAASLPSVEEEVWRYSPIYELDLDRFAPTEETSGPSFSVFENVATRSGAVEVRNGYVTWVELDDELASKGLFVGPLADHPDGADLLGSVVGEHADAFGELHDAFLGDAVVVDVPAGMVVDKPIVVGTRTSGDGIATFPRLIVRTGADSEVSVLDYHASRGGTSLVIPIVELDAGPASRLKYLNVEALGNTTWQLGHQVSRVGQEATLTAGTAALGGHYARMRSDCRLTGRGSSGNLLALYYGDGDQTLDFRTFQDHIAPDTTSNLLFKGALADESKSIYTGLIRVRPDARGTNAYQTNRNIKLSDKAWAESVPNLEIENSDVRCSHASTVSPIDADQLFYLESRGVPSLVAERLIIAGFFSEVLEALPVSEATGVIAKMISAKQDRHQSANKTESASP
ncbi:MAG: Fe-S cluster assembly protein SufD [Acidimicrobiales bacterium]